MLLRHRTFTVTWDGYCERWVVRDDGPAAGMLCQSEKPEIAIGMAMAAANKVSGLGEPVVVKVTDIRGKTWTYGVAKPPEGHLPN